MPATGNEAIRLSQLKSWWDTTIATISASINNKLDKPGTAATAGQVLSNNGTQNVWIDAPGGGSYVLPPAEEETLGGVTFSTGKAGYSGVVGNGTDELIVQNPVGKTSGAVMVVDDAYPTNPLELKVYGNTRQNMWVNPSGVYAGVSFTENEDGSVSVSGTSTSVVSAKKGQVFTFKPSTQYAFSVDKPVQSSSDPAGGSFYIEFHSSDGAGIAVQTKYVGYGSTTSITFTTTSDTAWAYIGFYCAAEKTVSGTYRVMLNEGDSAEPWCKPGLNSVSELSVVFEDDAEPANQTTVPIDQQGNQLCSLPDGTRDELDVVTGEIEKKVGYIASYDGEEVGENYISSALTETGEIASGAQVVYKLSEPQTIQLTPPELPALPSPNATAYASANVEAESEMVYVQLLNVVLSKLTSVYVE